MKRNPCTMRTESTPPRSSTTGQRATAARQPFSVIPTAAVKLPASEDESLASTFHDTICHGLLDVDEVAVPPLPDVIAGVVGLLAAASMDVERKACSTFASSTSVRSTVPTPLRACTDNSMPTGCSLTYNKLPLRPLWMP